MSAPCLTLTLNFCQNVFFVYMGKSLLTHCSCSTMKCTTFCIFFLIKKEKFFLFNNRYKPIYDYYWILRVEFLFYFLLILLLSKQNQFFFIGKLKAAHKHCRKFFEKGLKLSYRRFNHQRGRGF